ncbi:alanine racemase [Aestuariimicrobium ganziense]|uniref:alanine racemase n=1 Tax=Aestuariimicrobium ganziense TaxID=2773677 RepID=UPI001942648A|nr:alanine racemase [Aestuariimicrobium ganziense]
MSLVMHLDLAAWRAHLDATADAVGGLVPVAKGNGYGYGLPRLARETRRLRDRSSAGGGHGVDTLAVGTADEVALVRAGLDDQPGWDGDIVVLTPWSPHDPVATALLTDPRVISTVGRLDDLRHLDAMHPGARVLVEVLTSMRRHGLPRRDLARVGEVNGSLTLEGWTIHLPMRGNTTAEARQLARACTASVAMPLWLSHLDVEHFRLLSSEVNVETRLRLGTALWLGAPASRRITARVLDMHPVSRGDRIGYWQRPAWADGWVVVVSGGTAEGVAMAAPTPGSSMGQRARALVTGSMDAAGLALSPYTLDGRKRFFIEPPHMQSSLVFLPGAGSVAIGDEVTVEVRLTTATVDRVLES